MKKLTVSILGIAMVMGISSCNDHDFERPKTQKELKYEAYNEAFTEAFGYVYPSQSWGFDESIDYSKGDYTKKSTKTRVANVNGNQWYNGTFVYNGQKITFEEDPIATTDEQTAVLNYLRNMSLEERINHTKNIADYDKYFVTQIYGETTDKDTSYPGQNCTTSEIDNLADHMNFLYVHESATADATHINNFNAGNNQNYNFGGIGGKTLMLESGTYLFGYHNSQADYKSNKYITINGADISEDYAGFYYVCFDFERPVLDSDKEGETTFAYLTGTYKKKVVKISGGGKVFELNQPIHDSPKELTKSEIIDAMKNNPTSWWPQEWYDKNLQPNENNNVNNVNFDDVTLSVFSYRTDNWEHVVTYYTIQIIGTLKYNGIDDAAVVYAAGEEVEDWEEVTVNSDTKYSLSGYYTLSDLNNSEANLKAILGVTEDVDDLKVTVTKLGYLYGDKYTDGDNDFTDWIVRISPAIVKGEPQQPQKPAYNVARIFAEDLSDALNSDWDFNDVVVEVRYETNDNGDCIKSEVWLLAAGGTLPLNVRIDDSYTGNLVAKNNAVNGRKVDVHAAFGVTNLRTMINTNWRVSTERETLEYVKLFETDSYLHPNKVILEVSYDEGKNYVAIEAKKGEPAAKFCVPVELMWCDEQQPITGVDRFDGFDTWVQAQIPFWDGEVNNPSFGN